MKPDEAHIETDKKIAELEKRMRREYRQAAKEVEEKLADYFRRFEKKDEIKRAQLAAGEITKADYDGWRTGQMLAGKRWKEMRDTLAADLNAVNANARRIVNGERAEVYAENHNYATFEIEKAAKVDTAYTLYDRSTVERIAAEQPDVLPAPGKQMKSKLARGEAVRWQAGQIQSVTLQSILQGESIPNMAKRIGKTLGEKNYGTAVRYARTAMTGAQSAGRQDSYKRAEDMGINLKRRWVATLDMRTRHEHRMLDMQVRGIDEPFDAEGAEIMFPGDPNAPAHLIWNCRCRTIAEVEGLEHNWDRRSTDALEGMSYEEWKQAHGKSKPITAQTEKGEAAKRAAIAEYEKAGEPRNDTTKLVEFANGYDSNKYFRTASEALKADENASKAFNAWSFGSSEAINGYLRGNIDNISPSDLADAKDKVTTMRNWIDKQETKDDIKVYRTMDKSVFERETKDGVYRDKGFTATTTDFEAIAGGDPSADENVWLEILVSAGKGRGAYINNVSYYEDAEFEYLIKDGASFANKGSYIDADGREIIQLELLL